MKIKGFTLIELLAVIVILAIIALIAVPIILNIIDDARKQSDKRSIEMYGDAVKNAVAAYSLKNPADSAVTFEDIEKDYIEYDGSKVECSTHEIYSNGTIWLNGCTVNDKPVEYEYGKYQQIFVPKFYGSWSFSDGPLEIGGQLPSVKTETQPKSGFYLGLDTNDGSTISAAYVCFYRNGNAYCLKSSSDENDCKMNQQIIRGAFSDIIDTDDCNESLCYGDDISVDVENSCSDIRVFEKDSSYNCQVGSGIIQCQ